MTKTTNDNAASPHSENFPFPPPGDLLEETLDERRLAISDLAASSGLSENRIQALIKASVELSPDDALRLEKALNIPSRLWINFESNYRAAKKTSEQRDWVAKFPLREMVRHKYFAAPQQNLAAQLKALLDFFGIDDINSFDATTCTAARFRRSASGKPVDSFALAAWLRRTKLETERIPTLPYSKERFREILDDARKLTTVSPDVFQPKLTLMCASSGIALTFVPALPNLAVSGAAYWDNEKRGVISLNLHGRTNDKMWFSFFHEAKHILEHKIDKLYVDCDRDPDIDQAEKEANEFARDHLIKPDDYTRLLSIGRYTPATVSAFAKEIGICPGIVVGRLQHDDRLRHDQLNDLKKKYGWKHELDGAKD